MPFPMAFTRRETQATLSRIWTQVADFYVLRRLTLHEARLFLRFNFANSHTVDTDEKFIIW